MQLLPTSDEPRGVVASPATLRWTHRRLRIFYQFQDGPLTALALSVRAGARFDGPHPGLAHMAEHMLFQGTSNLDQMALNRRAAELGGEHNADTSFETISLTIEVFNEEVDSALALLADQYLRSAVEARRFAKERRVVLDEIRGRLSDPVERLYLRAWCTFFRGALAHPICGTATTLRQLQPADVAAFLSRHFLHANTALAVVGGVERNALAHAIRRHFSRRDPALPAPAAPVEYGTRRAIELRRRAEQGYFLQLLEVPPQPRAILATSLALEIVGVGPDSMLFQEVRERLGLGYDVSATLEWGPDWAVASLGASAPAQEVRRVEEVVRAIHERTSSRGFSDEDFERARKKLRYRYATLADERLGRALALTEGALLGFPTPAEAQAIVRAMTRAEVETTWRRVLAGHSLVGRLV